MKTREQWEKLLAEIPPEHADLLLSAAARTRQSLYGGGPAKKLLPCPKCGAMFSARDMRTHKPRCGAHMVPCRFGCGFTSNAMGAGQHEAICAQNPNSKKAVQ